MFSRFLTTQKLSTDEDEDEVLLKSFSREISQGDILRAMTYPIDFE